MPDDQDLYRILIRAILSDIVREVNTSVELRTTEKHCNEELTPMDSHFYYSKGPQPAMNDRQPCGGLLRSDYRPGMPPLLRHKRYSATRVGIRPPCIPTLLFPPRLEQPPFSLMIPMARGRKFRLEIPRPLMSACPAGVTERQLCPFTARDHVAQRGQERALEFISLKGVNNVEGDHL